MMKALVLVEKNVLEVKHVPIPKISPFEALIKVSFSGICATDKEIISGKMASPLPLILGHEICGTVVEKGELVKELKIGDRVVIDPAIPCGECRFCRTNRPEFCKTYRELGINVNGGWAEYVKAPVRCLHKIPKELSDTAAAVFEPMTCPFGAVEAAKVFPGEQVLIIGDGAAALYFTQIVRMLGAAGTTVIHKRADRKELLRKFGADFFIDSHDLTKLEQTHAVVEQGGFDLVIDAVGYSQTVMTAIQYARIGGRVVFYGFKDAYTEQFPHRDVILKNLTVFGRTNSPSVWPRAIDCVGRGLIDLEPMVEKVVTPEEAPAMLANADWFDGIKAVMKWN